MCGDYKDAPVRIRRSLGGGCAAVLAGPSRPNFTVSIFSKTGKSNECDCNGQHFYLNNAIFCFRVPVRWYIKKMFCAHLFERFVFSPLYEAHSNLRKTEEF